MKRSTLILILRALTVLLVVLALIYMVSKSKEQLVESDFRLADVDFVDWSLAVVAYLGSMLLSCVFWHRVLKAVGQQPEFTKSLLAFSASQLGKYVPGKAMVVIVRTDIIRGPNVKVGPAAASVFVETLSWIFVGAVIASLLLVFQFRDQRVLQVIALTMAIIAGILTWPSNFRRIAKRILARRVEDPSIFDGLDFATMGFGWLVMAVAWCLNGLSLWLVIRGLPGAEIIVRDYPLCLACVSLATVAGFVSLLPGGLGVRELVIIPLLGARFGPVIAVIAAIVIRLVWLASEFVASAIIYVGRKVTESRKY